jgi:hypothetical protein
MNGQYEVLNPWAEVDPIPLKGLSPRLTDITGKKIGLFINSKIVARPMQDIIEKQLKERFPKLEFSRFVRIPNISMAETQNWDKYQAWVKGVDAVILSHGD